MTKNFYNKNVLRALGAVFMVCFTVASSVKAATITAGTTGNWLTTGTWVGGVIPTTADSVVIPNGITVTITGTTEVAKGLNVQSGGTLNDDGTSNRTLKFQGGGAKLGFRIDGIVNCPNLQIASNNSLQVITIFGSGTDGSGGAPKLGRLQTSNVNCIMNVEISLQVMAAAGSAAINSNTKDNLIINIKNGATLTLQRGAYINASSSGALVESALSLTINVNGILTFTGGASSTASAISLLSNSTFKSTLNIGSTGIVNLTGQINGNSTVSAASVLIIANGGQLIMEGVSGAVGGNFNGSSLTSTSTIEGTIDFKLASSTRTLGTAVIGSTGKIRLQDNTFPTGGSFNATSTVEYYGSSAISMSATPTTYPNLTINNAAGVTLGAATTVSGILALTAGTLSLGANTLTIAGSVTKTSGNIDASASTATFTNTSAITLPTGVYTGSISALTINGTGGITLSEALTVTNALTLTSGNITLGTNDLTVGSTSGGSTSSHVFTNNTGYLKSAFVGGDTKTFPIGATTSSYDPFAATPTSATTFGASVSTINPAHVLSPTALAGSREWDLTSTAPSSTVLAFTPGDGRAVPASGVKLGHWNGSAWDMDIAATYSSGTFTGTASTFSPYIAAELAQPLSIELKNLAVKGNGATNVVYWATASEKNNATFNIERSTDGQDFNTIGTLKGNGTTTDVSNYTFTDNTPANGINYYRLRALDTDGKATISKTVSILNGKIATGLVKAYPSVSNAILTVDVVTEGVATLNIVDITGKTVLTKTIKDNGFSSNPMDISGLSNGVYVLMFKSANVQMIQKFVKN